MLCHGKNKARLATSAKYEVCTYRETNTPTFLSLQTLTMAAPNPQLDEILELIGVLDAAHRVRIIEESFPNGVSDFRSLTSSDIVDMAKDYNNRRTANQRINIGLAKVRRLKGVMHLIQDCVKTNKPLDQADVTLDTINTALERAAARKTFTDQMDTNAKSANPGKFEKEKDWQKWSDAFVNFLSVIPGSTGIPLSYVVREKEDPEPNADYTDFHAEMIACAPLNGGTFNTDRRSVHQYLLSFTVGKPAEEWIKKSYPMGGNHNNGRRSFRALSEHYGGSGNSSRRIAEAEALMKNLFYKSERSLQFNTFLSKMEHMFNIYKEQGEEKGEAEKLRILFRKIQCSSLATAVSSLAVKQDTDGLTYDEAINHLSTRVSQLPHTQRFVSELDTKREGGRGTGRGRGNRGARGGRGRGRGRNSNREGYIPLSEWRRLSYQEKKEIFEKRKNTPEGDQTRKVKQVKFNVDDISTAIISAVTQASSLDSNKGEDEYTSRSKTRAGIQFGGREEAANKNQKNKE